MDPAKQQANKAAAQTFGLKVHELYCDLLSWQRSNGEDRTHPDIKEAIECMDRASILLAHVAEVADREQQEEVKRVWDESLSILGKDVAPNCTGDRNCAATKHAPGCDRKYFE